MTPADKRQDETKQFWKFRLPNGKVIRSEDLPPATLRLYEITIGHHMDHPHGVFLVVAYSPALAEQQVHEFLAEQTYEAQRRLKAKEEKGEEVNIWDVDHAKSSSADILQITLRAETAQPDKCWQAQRRTPLILPRSSRRYRIEE